MGCKQSRTIRVQPISLDKSNTQRSPGKISKTDSKSDIFSVEYELDSEGNKVLKEKKSRLHRGKKTQSLSGARLPDGERGLSATSKASADSGLGLAGEDYTYGQDLGENIITEYSPQDEVNKVERCFVERGNLELGITGVPLPTRLGGKQQVRQDEETILQSLLKEGLIAKPATESSGGVSFDIVTKDSFDFPGLPRPPPRQLEKLERRRKKKRVLTEEEIKEKLERAERRRKNREEEKINRIKTLEKSDALAALDNFEQYKKEKEELQTQKMDTVADNREKKLNEIKEKIKERERRAIEVRKRKQKALEEGLEATGIITNTDPDDVPVEH
ncbi:uncharacterized protein LOC106064329 [Biomphalaria glabrata]|uniref:Uncharacterized protein LOC106064329 n=1 Tax=Biomphalaria glabrata TaxID=6526 RepID=A0A9U8E922_BIOGL|nr:uncharacterized protein LOC106064329 [Biomphalaria glabrata]